MFKSKCILAICLAFFLYSPTQSQQNIITITKEKGELKISKLPSQKIKKGDFYKIKLKGVNLNNYKIIINSKDTIISPKVTIPDFGSFPIELLQNIIESDEVKTIIANLKEASGKTSSIIPNAYSNNIGLLTSSDLKKKNTTSDDVIISSAWDEIWLLELEEERIKSFADALWQITQNIDQLKLKIYLSQLNYKRDSLSKEGLISFKVVLAEIQTLRNQLKSTRVEIQEAIKKSEEGAKEASASTKKAKEAFAKQYADLLTSIESATKSIDAKTIHQLLSSLLYMEDNTKNGFQVTRQFQGEKEMINISLLPWENDSRLPSYHTAFTFPKTTTYTEVGISFYYSELYDKEYSIIGDTEMAPSYRLVEEDKAKGEIGTTILLRYGGRLKPGLGIHATIGPGISINRKLRPRLLMGGGFAIGRHHMLTFDGGFIAGYVDRKSNAFNLDVNYATVPEQITIPKLKLNYFISIGVIYNINF